MKHLKTFATVIIIIGLYLGVRYIGAAIHYGCVNPAEDCVPPIHGVGQLGFYLTGGNLVPLWNRDATTVTNVSWVIEKAGAGTGDEQRIGADVTTLDGKTGRVDLGTAYGCVGRSMNEIEDHKIMMGKIDCSAAGSVTKFAAFSHGPRFSIERYDVSAIDGGITTTVLLEI